MSKIEWLKYNKITLFLSIVWRRIDSRCPNRMDIATAREVACIMYPKPDGKEWSQYPQSGTGG